MVKTKEMLRALSLLIISLVYTACFQPESGCLDIEAKNFEPTADEGCAIDDDATSCPCIYPILSFDTIDYVFGKFEYEPDSIYQIEAQEIRIASVKFYISDFQFFQKGGDWIGVLDTISLVVLNEESQLFTETFTNDFEIVHQQNIIDMGMLRQSGAFDSLKFVVGIREVPNSANPDSISNTGHPLANMEMHTGSQELGYIFNQITLFKDTTTVDPIILNISGNENLVEIKMPFSYNTPLGKDFSFGTLRIDYEKWFHGINFVGSEEEIINQIVKNTPEVFSVSN